MSETQNSAFLKLPQDIQRGQVISEASDKLTELVAACKDTGRKGELRLRVIISPSPNGETMSVIIPDVELKKPKKDRKAHTFFPTESNQLSRNNPEQPEFRLGVVPGGEATQEQQPQAVSQ